MMRTITTCGAILIDETGKVLIVRRSQTDKHRPLQWDLPGGHVEEGESLVAGLTREVREETGLDIVDTAPKLVYAASATFDEVSVTWLFFVVHVQNSDISLSPEHDNYQWVSIDEAIELVEYERKNTALVYAHDNGLLD